MRDELGYRQTKGKGTMQYLLDELLGKAEEQLRRLNETRSQLASVRQELVTTIEELNQRKASLRSSLGEIAQLRQTVTEKDTQIAELGDQVQQLEEDKRGLEDEIAGQKNLIAKIEEEKRDLEEEVVALEKRLKGVPPPVDHPAARKVDPGIKGRVASVNRDWNFAIVSLNDEFLRGVLGEDLAGEFQPVELLVKRADVAGDFVTKVRITQVKRDKRLGIADILSEWQQAPVMAGDIVFY
jgi:chromosome segregation ATPase